MNVEGVKVETIARDAERVLFEGKPGRIKLLLDCLLSIACSLLGLLKLQLAASKAADTIEAHGALRRRAKDEAMAAVLAQQGEGESEPGPTGGGHGSE